MDSDIFQDTDYDGVEEYEEELTAAEVLQKLEDAWLNEKHSPELLDPKMEIVECMLEQVTEGCHPAKPYPALSGQQYEREPVPAEERRPEDPCSQDGDLQDKVPHQLLPASEVGQDPVLHLPLQGG